MSFDRLAALSLVLLALPGLGCSEEVPPEPSGAWKVNFVDSGQQCGIGSHNGLVGTVTDTESTAVVTNNKDGAKVACAVQGSSSFSVDASAEAGGYFLQIVVSSISAAATVDAPVDGTAIYASPNTGDTFSSSSGKPCKFWFGTSSQTVAAGSVWLSFACDEISGGESTACALEHGIATFSDCKTGEEDE